MFQTEYQNGQKLIRIPRGLHRIAEPIVISEDNVRVLGEDGACLTACVPLGAAWEDMGNGSFRTKPGIRPDVLYVNGVKYRMSRYPKCDPCNMTAITEDCLSRERTDRWKDPAGGYIHALHRYLWGGFSYRITGKAPDGSLLWEGGWQNNRQLGMHEKYRYAENIAEELTEPGEWYYNEKTNELYVIPMPGHDLLTAEGAENHCFFLLENVRGVTIENLTMMCSARTFMRTREPLLRSDWTVFRGGAVYLHNVRDCRVLGCTLEDIGSNGIFLDGDCADTEIRSCRIHKIGGSGAAFVGRPESVRSPLFCYDETHVLSELDVTPGPRNDDYPKHCTISDCLISDVGTVEKQAAGVEISMAAYITVDHCSIYDTPRAGINISEGTFGGHRIIGCDVFDTVRETGDHGSFNSWGRDRFWHVRDLPDAEAHRYASLDVLAPTEIAYSRFRCDRGWDIDLDDGSGYYDIHHNLCLAGGIKLREGFSRHVHHNITVNNSLHLHVWYPDSGDILENNLVFDGYKPILMPQDVPWGKRIGGTVLHTPGQKTPVPAAVLHEITGDDADSVRVECVFRDAENGDYTPVSPVIDGFSDFQTAFGVQSPALRAAARTPVLPSMERKNNCPADVVGAESVFGMLVKNIETDGEMSAYGTAEKNGVIVLDVSGCPEAEKIGLSANDVITAAGGTPIRCVSDLSAQKNLFSGEIFIQRAQVPMVLK